MKQVKEDLWTHHRNHEWICITTNGFVKNDGRAVMGRGCAKEAKIICPEIDHELGMLLKSSGNQCYIFEEHRVITFPTKHNWWESSSLGLIKKSLGQLFSIVDLLAIEKIYLPRPGCSNGKLSWEKQVRPLLAKMFALRPQMRDKIIIISKGR